MANTSSWLKYDLPNKSLETHRRASIRTKRTENWKYYPSPLFRCCKLWHKIIKHSQNFPVNFCYSDKAQQTQQNTQWNFHKLLIMQLPNLYEYIVIEYERMIKISISFWAAKSHIIRDGGGCACAKMPAVYKFAISKMRPSDKVRYFRFRQRQVLAHFGWLTGVYIFGGGMAQKRSFAGKCEPCMTSWDNDATLTFLIKPLVYGNIAIMCLRLVPNAIRHEVDDSRWMQRWPRSNCYTLIWCQGMSSWVI